MAELDVSIAEFLSESCCYIVPLGLIIMLVAIVQVVRKRKSWKIMLSWLSILLVAGVLIGASVHSVLTLKWLTEEYYIITISIDEDGNTTEPIELFLPLPADYHGDFDYFTVINITSKEVVPVEERPEDLSYGVVNTSIGRMLSVSTSQPLILFSRSSGSAGKVYMYDAKFVDQNGGMVPLYLEPTSHSTSVAVYHELYFMYQYFANWESRYSAVAGSEPEFEELYHDFNLDSLSVDRLRIVPAPLVNGWQNLTVHSGSFDHAS